METDTPEAVHASAALRQARVAERSLTLFEEGYRLEEDRTFDGFYTVHGPEGQRYTVVVDDMQQSCSCPHFTHHKYCKHLWGVRNELLKMEQQAERLEECHEARFYRPF